MKQLKEELQVDTVFKTMNKEKVNKWINELSKYGTWHYCKNELPDINEGDGNMVRVGVKTDRGLRGTCCYGTSGFAGEGCHFFQPIRTQCGDVVTNDDIIEWSYIKPV